MTRLEWFRNKKDYSKMLAHYEYGDCDEFVVDMWGDVCTFRVYGSKESEYSICER